MKSLVEGPGTQLHACYYSDLLTSSHVSQGGDLEKLTNTERRMLIAWLTALGLPEAAPQGWTLAPVRQLMSWLARHVHQSRDESTIRVLTEFAVRFVREVSTYIDDPDCRRAVRERLTTALKHHKPDILIAHSLGSVVAYETLWCNHAIQLPLLVTVGSPLGLPAGVFDRLEPAPMPDSLDLSTKKGHRSPNVKQWTNIADIGDLVAIPNGLSRYFHGIDKDRQINIGIVGWHKFELYLAHRSMADALRPGIN